MPQVLTKSRVIGDFLRSFPSLAYCMGSRPVHNAGVEDIDLRILATPVSKQEVAGVEVYQVVFAGQEATADAFLVEDYNESIAAGENGPTKRAGLERGWAVVSREGLPENDPLGAPYDIDALVARFAVMNPPVVIYDNTGNRQLENLLRN